MHITLRRRLWPILTCLLVFFFSSVERPNAQTPASTQPSGIVEGRVTDVTTGEPLPGAKVMVAGTAIETATARDGSYRLIGVPPGARQVIVSYLGRKDATVDVEVDAAAPRHLDVTLPPTYEETVTVSADLIRGAEERALNQQRSAPNIMNVVSADRIGSFPDRNAAETTQRIAGVSITKDQGEGRYVNIRGTDPRLNAVMINGERVPAPDPLQRQVALDVVPSEVLESIEVSKALTPDVDADSIGGSVNLVMRRAPEQPRLIGSAGGGYTALLSTYEQSNFSATAGRRFSGGRSGAIVSFSGAQTTRGNQDVEVTYTNNLALSELNPRYYQVNRKRFGLSGAWDLAQGGGGGVTVRGVFNRFIDDHENRQRVRWNVASSRIDHELRDRTHVERIGSLSLSGQQLFADKTLDFQVLGAYSDQDDPLTMTTVFRQPRVTYAPNVTPTSIDPDNVQANPLNDDPALANFNQQVRATNYAKDMDIVGAVNLRMPLRTSTDTAAFLKVGGKFRHKQKGRTRFENILTTSATLPMTNYLEDGFGSLPPFLDGRYDLRPYVSQDAVANIPSQATMTVTQNHARDAEEFDGTENTTAAYGMAEIYAGPRLFILPGLRVEYTSADFTGRDVLFANGVWLGTSPLPAKGDYAVLLPGVHLKYALDSDSNLRFAVTRTLARPNYYDIVPYNAQDDLALTLMQGNADLEPTRSWNVDLLGERYFRSIGVVSGGVFYKRLQDYIFTFSTPEVINGVTYQVSQPRNGDTATVFGVELAVQNQFSFLPAPFDGIGVYANYTFTDSSAHLPDHPGESSLPGQSRHVGNVAASYEKFGFSGRVAVNFHGSYIDMVGATSTFDRFYDTNTQLDISLNQRITRLVRVYFDMLNLNDSLLRYYQGVPDRVLQEEHYRWSALFGVKVGL